MISPTPTAPRSPSRAGHSSTKPTTTPASSATRTPRPGHPACRTASAHRGTRCAGRRPSSNGCGNIPRYPARDDSTWTRAIPSTSATAARRTSTRRSSHRSAHRPALINTLHRLLREQRDHPADHRDRAVPTRPRRGGGTMSEPDRRTHTHEVITNALVGRLIAAQFPAWASLPLQPVRSTGTDNAIYRLGVDLAVRLPRTPAAAGQTDKEHHWLPQLAPLLPLDIPVPLATGTPGEGYPWPWSVHQWLEGEDLLTEPAADPHRLAIELGNFLTALQQADSTGGPPPYGTRPCAHPAGTARQYGSTAISSPGIYSPTPAVYRPSSTSAAWAWEIRPATRWPPGPCCPPKTAKRSETRSEPMTRPGHEAAAGRCPSDSSPCPTTRTATPPSPASPGAPSTRPSPTHRGHRSATPAKLTRRNPNP